MAAERNANDDRLAQDEVLPRYDEPGGSHGVVLEDDGRVAYAYLLNGDNHIVAHVWLYNVELAEPGPETYGEPPRNQGQLSDPSLRVTAESGVRCDWDARGVDVHLDGLYTARLEFDDKPGWSRLIRTAGPLGRPLFPLERFARAELLAADDTRRGTLCTELGELLTMRLAGVKRFHGAVAALIAELRSVGHDLWSFDEDDDFETWCPNWAPASGPGLVITFRTGRVEVTWSKH